MGTATPGAAGVQATIDELGTPLRDVTFVVVDLETTGGAAEDCGITEFGAVKVRGGEVLGEFQTLVNPGAPIPPLVAVLTGITDRLVAAPRRWPRPSRRSSSSPGARCSSLTTRRTTPGSCARHAPVTACPGRTPSSSTRHGSLGTSSRGTTCATQAGHTGGVFRSPVTPDHRALDRRPATVHVLHALMERVGNLGVQSLEELAAYSSRVPPRPGGSGGWPTTCRTRQGCTCSSTSGARRST